MIGQRKEIVNLKDLLDSLVSSHVSIVAANAALKTASETLVEVRTEAEKVNGVLETSLRVQNEIVEDKEQVAKNAVTVASNTAITTMYRNEAINYRDDALLYLAAAMTKYDEYDDRYLGNFAQGPVLDNDGMPIQEGALYWNLLEKTMYVRDSEAGIWKKLADAGSGSLIPGFNLGDLPSKEEARENLDVYSKEEVDDRLAGGYQGEYTVDPIESKYGGPLEDKSIYYNILTEEFKVYNLPDGATLNRPTLITSDKNVVFTLEAVHGDNLISSTDLVDNGNNINIKGNVFPGDSFLGSFEITLNNVTATTPISLSRTFDVNINTSLPVGVYDISIRMIGETQAGPFEDEVVFLQQLTVIDVQRDSAPGTWTAIPLISKNRDILMHPNKLTEDLVLPPHFNAIIYGGLDLNGFNIISDETNKILWLNDSDGTPSEGGSVTPPGSSTVYFSAIQGDPATNTALVNLINSRISESISANNTIITGSINEVKQSVLDTNVNVKTNADEIEKLKQAIAGLGSGVVTTEW